MAANNTHPHPLSPISTPTHSFLLPAKQIYTADDIPLFHNSLAHARITTFLLKLNAAVTPISTTPPTPYQDLETHSEKIVVSERVQGIINLLKELEELVKEAPPLEGPRRFGNAAFRDWHKLADERIASGDLLERHLAKDLFSSSANAEEGKKELASYLMGSFGSKQRLDYGTGHELSFLAFLGGIYLLGGFERDGDEKALATKCLDAYLRLIRILVKTYNLEPAGSHGVWGLDDHSFLPYIFGSAQLTTYPAGGEDAEAPPDIPRPADIIKPKIVSEWRTRNHYFGAVGFINDVKTGPFWEHSPILYDVSGVKGGWGKINQGMIKMFNVEVLSKFPVVQHFHFGSLFPWPTPTTTSATSTSTSTPTAPTSTDSHPLTQPERDPWAKPGSLPPIQPMLSTPPRPAGIPPPSSSPSSSTTPSIPITTAVPSSAPGAGMPERFDSGPAKPVAWEPTRAPWATGPKAVPAAAAAARGPRPTTGAPPVAGGAGPIMTRAPWAEKDEEEQEGKGGGAVMTKAPWAK